MNSHNPYASSQADLYQPASVEQVLAGRGERLVAVIIDYVAVGVLGGVAALVVPASHGNSTLGLAFGGVAGAVTLGVVIYNFVLLHRQGQTIGKRIMNICVLRSDGSRCSLRRYIFLRFFPVLLIAGILDTAGPLGTIFSVVDSLMIFRDSRQCLHDVIADTIVVKTHA